MEDAREHDGRAGTRRGHRLVPHTADLIVEAWAGTRTGCLEEAAIALVEAFCDASDVVGTEPVPVALDARSDLDLLVGVLEEVVYLAEVIGVVPVTVSLEEADGGGVAGSFEVARVCDSALTGAVPKGVSYGDLRFGRRDDGWFCRAVVDV